MRSVKELLDRTKYKTGSDYRTADLIGVERQTVSGWRRHHSKPKNIHIMKICELSGIEFEDAVIAIELDEGYGEQASRDYWEARYQERVKIIARYTKQAGYAALGNVAALSGMSLAVVTSSPGIALLTGFSAAGLYIMSNEAANDPVYTAANPNIIALVRSA